MILTKSISSRIDYCAPNNPNLEELLSAENQEIFAPIVTDFLNLLSTEILEDRRSREFPDVLAFALWCRSLKRGEYQSEKFGRFGRGLVFHVTPGNVPINFAYSLVSGLLSGNKNIVRLPSKKYDQIEFFLKKVNLFLDQEIYSQVRERMILLRYPRDKSINDFFSGICDVRVIWGGNQTIDEIRASKIPAKSTEITFADRFSFCSINSAEYLKSSEKIRIAHAFYNDTYLFDQNACTAPHLIAWVGERETSEKASQIFWEDIETITTNRYSIEAVQIIDKLVAAARFSASNPGAKLVRNSDNKIFRIKVNSISYRIEDFKSHSGLFYELNVSSLIELDKIINSNFQTMTYFGFTSAELDLFIQESSKRGIDRIVPMGKSLDFSLFWDGHDLISALSRKITFCE